MRHHASLRHWLNASAVPNSQMFPEEMGRFPQKNPGKAARFLELWETFDLLRTRALRSVRETFTEGSGTSVSQKARATATGYAKVESRAQATLSRVK